MFEKNTAVKIAGAVAISLLFIPVANGLYGSLPKGRMVFADGDNGNDIAYRYVDAPEAKSADGVISAEEWGDIYPEIVASMQTNADNSYRISYIDEDPYITNLYEGYGFAIDYTSAIGHNYGLEDVHDTQRPHPLANCLTCKTPNFTKLVNDLGEEVYQYDFEETWQQMQENTSCYNCHENLAGEGGELVVTHSYIKKALGNNISTINSAVLSCGQCHIEYYFDPETKATASPVSGIDTMHPSKILEYYNAIDFADWTQESTGTRMLKAQHPEMETYLLGVHANLTDPTDHNSTMDCATCHMAITTSEDGTVYHSHKWESPLENQALLDTCASCHGTTDMTEKVHTLQDEITGRETEVGEKLSALKDALAEAVSAGELGEDALEEIRRLYREAQWYWDFCYVENSEGAHNSALARECLDTSESIIAEAMGKFEV